MDGRIIRLGRLFVSRPNAKYRASICLPSETDFTSLSIGHWQCLLEQSNCLPPIISRHLVGSNTELRPPVAAKLNA